MNSPKMYILVNSSLSMGKGKIAAQVGHGVSNMVRLMERQSISSESVQNYKHWLRDLEAKIVLKCPESDLNQLLKEYGILNNVVPNTSVFAVPVFDAGRTQIEAGSFTSLTFCPMMSENVPEIVRKCKLL